MTDARPLRILHLASSHRWTGAAEPAADLARAQMELGHDVRFACVEGHSFWRKLEARGVPFVPGFNFGSTRNLLSASISDIGRLREVVREGGFDVVHCHLAHDHWEAGIAKALGWEANGGKPSEGPAEGQLGGATGAGESTRAAERGRKGPLLVRTFHRDRPVRSDPASRWLFTKQTDLLIAVSDLGRAETVRRLGLSEERVVWVRGAVDLERFNPSVSGEGFRREFGIPREAAVAGMVARMQPHRGHLQFIEALEPALERAPEARFIVAGRGELKKTVRAVVAEHPRRDRLANVGYRKRDLEQVYAAMDVLVLLARGSDGTCRAMLEAMAAGRPVIGIREGAMADTIVPGETGWLIDSGRDGRELAETIAEALSDRARLAEMGRAARARIERDFTQEARAKATVEAYRRALERLE